MVESSNALWKVDLLEHKFFKYPVRYKSSLKLLAAKNNQKLLKKMPATKEEAEKEIISIKSQVFQNKYHGAVTKLKAEVTKLINSDLRTLKLSSSVNEFLKNEELVRSLIISKVIKVIQLSVLNSKQAKESSPKFLPEDIITIINDKNHENNPSMFFKQHCQNNKDVNNYISNLWNKKNIKARLAKIDWSFRLVRGNLTEKEVSDRRSALGQVDSNDAKNKESESDESDEENEESSSEEEGDEPALTDADLDKFAIYDNLVAASDEEGPELDPNVNYNEVTDEEPSEDESEDEDSEDESEDEDSEDEESDSKEEKPKKQKKAEVKDDFLTSDVESEDDIEKKYNLPELATGYISGGSDDENFDVDNDKIVRQATTQRKNRRGQRARQKIWEKKYGKGAKHKQKEIEAIENDKKRRQLEFEERERKRQMRAKEAIENAPSGSNLTPLGARESKKEKPAKEEHPSWLARKQAEEKMKNTKFTGKKITFD